MSSSKSQSGQINYQQLVKDVKNSEQNQSRAIGGDETNATQTEPTVPNVVEESTLAPGQGTRLGQYSYQNEIQLIGAIVGGIVASKGLKEFYRAGFGARQVKQDLIEQVVQLAKELVMEVQNG